MKKFLAALLSTVSIITFSGGLYSYAQNVSTAEATSLEVDTTGEDTVTSKESTVSENPASENDISDGAAEESAAQKNTLENISYSKVSNNEGEEFEQIHINASGLRHYNITEMTDPLRLVIDLKNTRVPDGMGIIQAGSKYVKRIRYAQFTASAARVVLDVKQGYDYSVEQTENGLTVLVYTKQEDSELKKSKAISFGGGYGIKFTGSGIDEKVTIDLGRYDGYSIKRVTNPEKLIITIPDTVISGRERAFETGGSRVSSIGYTRSGQSGAVITIGLKSQFQYVTEESDGKLVLSFVWPSYKNIMYENNQDRVNFLIKKARLTEGTKNLKPLYTESMDESANIYEVTFPSENADIGEGIIDINDAYLKSFEVRKNSDGTTSLIFTGQSPNKYLIYTRDSGDTAVTIAKASDTDRDLVVIDAGHGGTATGAYYGKLYEKDLNLDIVKRLNTLLKNGGIDTYLIRSDDSNVDNYERAYIANMLDAELYLSVHNNAAPSKSVKGIMTLYCPSSQSGFTGKDFAEIIQSKLLKALNNKDLNIRSRSDLIVLRETDMPAALAEVAFLSNSADRANLMKETYRQKAAQALYDSVVIAMDKAVTNGR